MISFIDEHRSAFGVEPIQAAADCLVNLRRERCHPTGRGPPVGPSPPRYRPEDRDMPREGLGPSLRQMPLKNLPDKGRAAPHGRMPPTTGSTSGIGLAIARLKASKDHFRGRIPVRSQSHVLSKWASMASLLSNSAPPIIADEVGSATIQ